MICFPFFYAAFSRMFHALESRHGGGMRARGISCFIKFRLYYSMKRRFANNARLHKFRLYPSVLIQLSILHVHILYERRGQEQRVERRNVWQRLTLPTEQWGPYQLNLKENSSVGFHCGYCKGAYLTFTDGHGWVFDTHFQRIRVYFPTRYRCAVPRLPQQPAWSNWKIMPHNIPLPASCFDERIYQACFFFR